MASAASIAAENTLTIDQLWERANTAFSLAEGFGFDIARHAGGFCVASVTRRYPDESFVILSHETAKRPADALLAAIEMAQRNIRLDIDWMAHDLPKVAAQ